VRSLELDLDVYQGPFDLLLSLVFTEDVDLFEVPLCEVILAYLEGWEEAEGERPWDEITEFLILMSMLLEIKSRLLLPGGEAGVEPDLTPEQARDQLYARLCTYSQFKAASLWLRDRGQAVAGCLLRPPQSERRRRLPSLDSIVGTGDPLVLREALKRLLESKREPDTSHLAEMKVELQRQIRIIRRILARRGRLSFERVFGGEPPLVQAVSLFALLDLASRGEVRLTQARPFADIEVRPTVPKEAGVR
jgi:segregation and condensation protein A